MTDTGLRTVRFVSDALPDDTFDLLDLHGLEELSRLFAFQLRLAVREPERVRGQTHALLEAPAHLVFFDDGREVRRVHGVLSELSLDLDVELAQAELTATLVPRVWALTQRHASELALDTSLPQLLVERLTRLGLVEGDDFQLRLLGRYESREMVVQHQESDWAFLSRLCEQVGLFFAFEHASGRDVLVFGDQPDDLWSTPVVEVPYRRRGDTRGAFSVREEVRRGPSAVQLGDYNYRLPGVPLRGQHEVAGAGGWGVQRLWGEHVKTPEEAEARALVRAQQGAQERSRVSGQTTELRLTAGSVLVLSDPFGSERRVLVTRLATHVSTTVDGSGGLVATSETSFDGLPEGAVFRPERRTPWPRVTGLMHAVVDGAADGTYAELDGEGRYQVVFGHDPTTQGAMQRSRPVRMLQPHGGGDYGMHFPLRPGTEVLVGHVEGDPDRPVIVGVAPNPTIASPVSAGNGTQNVLRSGSRNELVMEDLLGQERVRLHSPAHNSTLQLGSEEEAEAGALLRTSGSATTASRHACNALSTRCTTLAAAAVTLAAGPGLLVAGLPSLQEAADEGLDSFATLSAHRQPLVGQLQSLAESRRSHSDHEQDHEDAVVDEAPGGSLWSAVCDELAQTAQSQAMTLLHALCREADDDTQQSRGRLEGQRLDEPTDQSALVVASDTAALVGRQRALVHGDDVAVLSSDDTATVVGRSLARVMSPGQVEVAGNDSVRLTTCGLLDAACTQFALVAGYYPGAEPEPLSESTSLGLMARLDLRLVSIEHCIFACAHENFVASAHQGEMTLTAKKKIALKGGSVQAQGGSITLSSGGEIEVNAGGGITIKADGNITIKAPDVILDAANILLLGDVGVTGTLSVIKELTAASGIKSS